MANSRSWWVCGDRAWPPLTVNSRSWFWAFSSRRGRARLWQVQQGVSYQRMWSFFFCVNFFKSRCFVSRRHVVPWEVARRFEHDTFNVHAACSFIIRYAMFHLAQIVTVGSKFWKGLWSQSLILPLSPQLLISTECDPMARIQLSLGL